jgi:hypothetical protein
LTPLKSLVRPLSVSWRSRRRAPFGHTSSSRNLSVVPAVDVSSMLLRSQHSVGTHRGVMLMGRIYLGRAQR